MGRGRSQTNAGAQHGAGLVVLRMAEITLIDAVVSAQMIAEVGRNLGTCARCWRIWGDYSRG